MFTVPHISTLVKLYYVMSVGLPEGLEFRFTIAQAYLANFIPKPHAHGSYHTHINIMVRLNDPYRNVQC